MIVGAGIAPSTNDNVGCTIDNCDEANDVITHIVDDSYCSEVLNKETCYWQSRGHLTLHWIIEYIKIALLALSIILIFLLKRTGCHKGQN